MCGVSSEPFYANIRRQAEAALGAAGVPGIVIAFRQSDGPISRVMIGEDAFGRPLEIDSLFPIASITKLTTALVVLQLVDSDEINLDAPLSTVLPDARGARPGATVRRLLSHSTGLPYDVDMTWVRTATTVDWSGFA